MNDREIIERTEMFVHAHLDGEVTGHDWWHADRVRRLALQIVAAEGADPLVAELAALLHDIADEKFSGDLAASGTLARHFLHDLGVQPGVIDAVVTIIANVSFEGAGVAEAAMSREGACVRDADRLDAIGAIALARVFAYGGRIGRPIYDPNIPPFLATDPAQYRAHRQQGTSINHFYEKLLLLADRMSTATGRQMAQERHQYMLDFLARFADEWAGRD